MCPNQHLKYPQTQIILHSKFDPSTTFVIKVHARGLNQDKKMDLKDIKMKEETTAYTYYVIAAASCTF